MPSHLQTERIHFKTQSTLDFHALTVSIAATSMKNELDKLVGTVEPCKRKNFQYQMDSFFGLYRRYLMDNVKGSELNWNHVQPLDAQSLPQHSDFPDVPNPRDVINKLAVLKLNGSVGTEFGLEIPKSMIEVRDGQTFLDLCVRQIEHLNRTYNVSVPIILMNSFATDSETVQYIKKYRGHSIDLSTFEQSRYPKVFRDTKVPVPTSSTSSQKEWYPPGHGDIFDSLIHSGMLDRLLAKGKEYLFVSNIDNLGASVDPQILYHLIQTQAEYVMELTEKTKADIRGGTLIHYEGNVRLLEFGQVPSQHIEEFKSDKKFKHFNTNNIWLYLPAVKRVVSKRELNMEIIPRLDTIEVDGEQAETLQLETAIGAAIQNFKKAHGISVPRSRFLPVKSSSDLLIIRSDLFHEDHGLFVLDSRRYGMSTPVVRLGSHFQSLSDMQKHIPFIPKLLELDHLTVAGNVKLGRNVTCKGTVIIVCTDGEITIPPNAVLKNCVVTGSCSISEH
ncbi:UTP-glucose-1-phosphate uridylyltransferase [Schizosaccharomyces japonicus yFS275]|uniref:UTP--glucose-1-phosphate uridylyltransferase n=1 Tax=Schizosaccharomyces japonicus (strain yFS275 / FY16936) TaxID=402676 RepID=B6K1R6_SCHJY|nr:UTP-glucose-1-phosphate uridylyltransferase [Schizosaccharomyces japonicus yFS275]EEB07097.1 UTP-glucose-1-phosphate uridylyltransferase [Schizosaccharomyces japonicus yFS275]